MRAQEFTTEAFDQPYKLKWEKGDYGDVDAIAKLDDGNYLSIMFNKGYSQGSKEEAWSVEFFRNNSQEVTGEGDAQRVFATVLSAIQTFIKKYKPNRVIFSASKEVEPGQKAQSRARLYDSLVQRYAKAWGFRAFRADTGNKVIYELNKIKPVAKGSLNEFAPPGGNDGDDGFSEETLKRLASQWYNGDEDPRVERTLMAAGWEIGQDEGYDDEPGVFVVQSGDVNGNSYISWPAHELRQGVAENFADGKKPGRKGLAKRSGVNCKQSVTKLRDIAAHSSGERQRMAHWCANMKSGKKK